MTAEERVWLDSDWGVIHRVCASKLAAFRDLETHSCAGKRFLDSSISSCSSLVVFFGRYSSQFPLGPTGTADKAITLTNSAYTCIGHGFAEESTPPPYVEARIGGSEQG